MKKISLEIPINQMTKSEIIYFILLSAVWITMTICVNPSGDFPLNDDWAYGKTVQSLVEKGEFQISDWAAPNLFSQIFWGALFCLPFGFSFTALRLSTLTLGLIGVLATYGLLRETNSTPKLAFFGALLVAVNPLYFGLSNTFMTDVPFFAFAAVAIYLLIQGLRRNSGTEIFWGIIIASIALLVRQLGIAIFLAFSCAYIINKGINIRNIIKGFSFSLLGLFLQISYQKWLQLIEGTPALYGKQASNIFNIIFTNLGDALLNIGYRSPIALIYLGLFIFPLLMILFLMKLKEFNYKDKILTIFSLSTLSMVLIGLLIFKHKRMPLSNNVLNDFGLGPLTLRGGSYMSHLMVPTALEVFWKILTVIGVIGAVMLILYLFWVFWQFYSDFKQSRFNNNWLTIFIIAAGLIYFLPLGIGGFFDRYLIFLVPLSLMLISVSTINRSNVQMSPILVYSGSFILLLWGLFTVGVTHDYLSWNRTRWQALNSLVKEYQVPPNSIDGGFEFNGWYLYQPKYQKTPNKSWWWVDQDDYIISFGPLAKYEEIKRYSFSKWLPFGPENILVLQKISPSS